MSNDASPSPAARATTIVLLALALLALAACASPLSALVPGGGSAIREEDAGGLAQQHWLEKYGESRDVTEVIRPRYATSIPWPNVDAESVVVNLGEKGSYDSLVLVDLKTGAVSDNHQSAEVCGALETYVRGHGADRKRHDRQGGGFGRPDGRDGRDPAHIQHAKSRELVLGLSRRRPGGRTHVLLGTL